MSENLYLTATRLVVLPSGKTEVESQILGILHQTPTKITHHIMSISSFEEQLNEYVKWADSRNEYEFEENDYEIIIEPSEYTTFDKEQFKAMINAGIKVEKVLWRGEKEFDDFIDERRENDLMVELYSNYWDGIYWIRPSEKHRWDVLKTIQDYKDREFDVVFSYI